ncbi:hypothetical protein H4582DRAFT_1911232 [Lactarius indigo]|nr:hypothetical protein H4582DRAFT_1911232 [Lactarius indigo]
MSLSSLGREGTTDTNYTPNSNPRLSSRSRSPSYDALSEHTRLFPGIQSHALLSPDVQLTPAAQQDLSDRASPNSSTMNTPNPSRSTSPLPPFYSTQSSASDTDSDEPLSPLLLDTYAPPYARDGPPRWWQVRQRPRRGARRPAGWFRPIVRISRRVFRHPFFPKHPSTILLSLLFFSLLALSITFLLIHLLNPDKEPLPWRAYCTSILAVVTALATATDGAGTSRTVVRFIMGQPRKTWERRVRVEMEEYNDYSTMAWVPPLYFDTEIPPPVFSYSKDSSPMLSLAPHDPVYARRDRQSASSLPQDWVRPDFVVKVDDDSFVMLAELEARLRIALHNNKVPLPGVEPVRDPLIYWGYLVKRRFMAGEMYALSWSLVDWVSTEPAVKGLTAKWMRLHPRAAQVRYSHGFLFPSEADRVRQGVRNFFDRQPIQPTDQTTTTPSWYDRDWNAPTEWSRSTVSTFGTRYVLPLPNLTVPQSIEALVEGSDMSGLYEGSIWSAEDAWQLREGRKKKYNGQRLGGTVVVHFIKKHMWFFETVLALLGGDEETEYEMQRRIQGRILSQIARHRAIGLD